MTPLVAVWLDDVLHFCTGPAEQKAVNLRGNDRVVLLTGCNQWDTGMDVVVEGRAARVTDGPTLAEARRCVDVQVGRPLDLRAGSGGLPERRR